MTLLVVEDGGGGNGSNSDDLGRERAVRRLILLVNLMGPPRQPQQSLPSPQQRVHHIHAYRAAAGLQNTDEMVAGNNEHRGILACRHAR
jgi:hypothetical protein